MPEITTPTEVTEQVGAQPSDTTDHTPPREETPEVATEPSSSDEASQEGSPSEEQSGEKETTRPPYRAEVAVVTSTILNRATKAAEGKKEPLSDAETKLLSLNDLSHHLESGLAEGPLEFNSRNPLVVITPSGEKVKIISINKADGKDTFTCRAYNDDPNKSSQIIELTGQTLLDGQLVTDAASIREGLSPTEQKVFDLRVASLQKGEEALDSRDSTGLNELITEAADEAGMITASTIHELAQKQLSSGELTEEQAKQLEELLAGKNILDVESTVKVLNIVGVTGQFNQNLEAAQRDYDEANATLQHSPTNPLAKERFESATQRLLEYKKIKPEALVREGLTHMLNGDIPKDAAVKIRSAFLSGKVDELAESVLAIREDDSEGTKNRKRLKQELLTQSGKLGKGGIGALYIAFLLLKESYEQIKK